MESIFEAITTTAPLETIKEMVFRHGSLLVEMFDSGGYDVMHCAIKANYPEVVRLLYMRGLFKSPHQPKTVPYLHYAAQLGRAAVASIILEEGPADFSKQYPMIICGQDIGLDSKLVAPFESGKDEASVSVHATYGLSESIHARMSPSGTSIMKDICLGRSQKASFVEYNKGPSGDKLSDNSTQQTELEYPLRIACDMLCDNVTAIHKSEEEETVTVSSDSVGYTMKLTALDVAALCRQHKCVELFLNSPLSGCKCESLLERACELNSSYALDLLLSGSPEETRAGFAFKEALRRKLPDCLDILLSSCVEFSSALNGINPYHVMYMYSSAYQRHGDFPRNTNMGQCTEVLLQHHINSSACSPPGSYPLYSLLYSLVRELEFDSSVSPDNHLRSLELLLKAGADPSFDELAHQVSQLTVNEEMFVMSYTVGRSLCSSAFNAVFGALTQSATGWCSEVADDVLYKVVRMLLKAGAEASRFDSAGETVLHEYSYCIALNHSLGAFSFDWRRIGGLLLQYGANPNVPCTSTGQCFLTTYFRTLFNTMPTDFAKEWQAQGSIQQIMHILSLTNLSVAQKEARNCIAFLQEMEIVDLNLLEYIQNHYRSITHEPRLLFLLCKLKVWNTIGRKEHLLHELPIPKMMLQKFMLLFF